MLKLSSLVNIDSFQLFYCYNYINWSFLYNSFTWENFKIAFETQLIEDIGAQSNLIHSKVVERLF